MADGTGSQSDVGARFADRIGPQLRRFLIGFFLVAAFVTTGAVLLFVITAEELQSSIGTVELGTAKTSIGAIRQDVATVEYYYKVVDVLTDKQNKAQTALYQTNVDKQAALAVLVSLTNNIRSYINLSDSEYVHSPLVLQPFQDSETGSDADRATVFDHAVAAYFAQYYAQLGKVSAPDQVRKDLETYKDETYKRLAPYLTALSKYDQYDAESQSLQAQIKALSERNSQLDKEVAPEGSALANTAYWNLCEDFFSFKTLVGDWAYSIVLLPRMMLVLLLSIFMGILGSLIYISKDFLTKPNANTFWEIVFRIGLGAGVAFALFFFAAAGMLALSQSGGTGQPQANMSPYLISFLGITGGYLSDHVTDWMRQVGMNAFKVEKVDQPPRWALGLEAALKTVGIDSAGLAAACGVSVSDADDWVSLAKPVPGGKQALVAAFLRMHPSRIFTDIAPAGANIAAQAIPAT